MRPRLLALVVCLLLPALSSATEYQFRTVDVPFATTRNTSVTGLNDQGVSVGTYVQAGGTTNGFRLQRPRSRFEVLPQLAPQVITNTEVIAGHNGSVSPRQGFVLIDGTFLEVRPGEPSGDRFGPFPAVLTEALDANDAGLVVGDFLSSVTQEFKGFVFDPRTFQSLVITIPGITGVRLSAINNLDELAAVGFDAANRTVSLLGDRVSQVFAPFTVPDLDDPVVEIAGLTDTGAVAVNVGSVGVVVQDGVAQVIEVPGAVVTDLQGIRPDLTVYGAYIDETGAVHGFIATPEGTRLTPRMHSAGLHRPFTATDCYPGCKRLVCRGD